ncbi:ArnT family glycosyltransferase [Metapseudomonas boanensis]|uniref:Glycosyltransferase family 39 protein n=1 Tax=Metapseudomonas boanensis TaxID=2822138 RepID=A0ABS5XQ05_9GAMM|nr:glycosyltransferase family 39 protein [Pseudomonas boanensis]MBT8769190.1 glycosyltransferase family 39 protein [Pseudomonas boanensis]
MQLSRSPRIELFLLLSLALLMIGAGLGLRGPANVDEERFLGVALEMLQSGDWLIPHRAGEIYPDKPPLFMWVVAFFIRLTGAPTLALFLPALLAGVVTTACLYDLGKRLWNRRIGVIAALLFLATYQTYSILRAGQIDGFLCLLIAISFYGMARHLLLGPAWGWFYVACAGMGFGIISKGVGFLPVLMLIPYAYAARKGWHGVVRMPGQARAWWLGLLVTLTAIGVWLVPLLLTVAFQGDESSRAYVAEILLRQTAQRYTSAWHHQEPFWYFFVKVIPKYWLPLVLALPWLVPAWRRELSKRDGRFLILLGWVVLVLLFFSLSTGKRKLYIFPALPGLVLAIAPLVPWLLHRWFSQRPRGRKVFIGLVVFWFIAWFARGFLEPIKEGVNERQVLMSEVAEKTHGADLVLSYWREGVWLYARQPIVHFGANTPNRTESAVQWLKDHPAAFALVSEPELARCFIPGKALKLEHAADGLAYLVQAEAINGQCQPLSTNPSYRFAWTTPFP